jgi:predicted DsbA family dithiol-disulfide isomerase/mRNA-degrading endonuclease toxin of MazEF toxin-antitoxin module
MGLGRGGLSRGDLVTVVLPGAYGKPRPALLIQGDAFAELPSATILPITSRLRNLPPLRIGIEPGPESGLRIPSQVQIDKVMTVPRRPSRGSSDIGRNRWEARRRRSRGHPLKRRGALQMKVEIWSDVVCPWCYIGKRRLETALDGFDEEVEVVWRSFELDPGAPRKPEEALDEALAAKYGMTLEQARDMMGQMTRTAAGEGLEFDFSRAQRGNTLDAHRLLHFAAERGVQAEMKERLLRAYLTEGRAISDPAELAALAGEVRLDVDEVAEMLDGDAFTDAVRRDGLRARELGVRGVPFFLIDEKIGIPGAQPPEVLRRGLASAREGS